MGLQEVSGGYEGLQGITRSYKWLQWDKEGYTGLKRVTGG